MIRSLCGIGLITGLLFLPIGVSAGEVSAQLAELFEDDWEFRLKQSPTFATFYGDRRYNDKLPVASVSANEHRESREKKFLERLRDIDRAALTPGEQLNYDIFGRLKENVIAEYEFRTYLMPITNRSGFHVSFPQLPDRIPLKSVKDYENYISRLRLFEMWTNDHIKLMREGMKRGYVLPAIVLEGIEGAIEPHIVEEPAKSILFKPFEDFPEKFSDRDREKLKKDGTRAIERSVVAGYKKFLTFLTYEYVPAARNDIGASSLPDGRKFYEHRVRYYTTLDLSPEEVHKTGLAEVKRIRAQMDDVIRRVEFEGTFDEFVDFLRSDDRFYVDKPDELMMHVSLVLKKMDGELPGLFKTLPRMPYGIKPVPDYIAPKTTTAYYNRPSGDGTRAGFYYVNTYDLRSRPLYEVEALSLHEAVPGHHLQIAIQQELTGIPEFRRFSGFTAFVEGWALYAERLGLEAGFYEDPYSDFGRLTYEMWRACRLVVDTGMHYLNWTRQEAIDFLAANTALTLHNITTEVDRYISWPGQALAYKIGELKIRELRELCERELGPRFDVRLFHDVVLGSGAVPLDVLEANVRSWLEVELARK
ncbi:MAG: DUF885 domain-containing protein [Candidatus Krumholzibacteria bacterium]